MQPKGEILSKTISASVDNGRKLVEDADLLFSWDRFSTALALSVLAQEEFSKAFLLQLVADGALPWVRSVQRSITRHHCKHLLALVMEWLGPTDSEQWNKMTERHRRRTEWLQRSIDRHKLGKHYPDPEDPEPIEPEIPFPPEVVKALNIYRHEEIERLFQKGNPWKDSDWSSGQARKIADGSHDKIKQSALYVAVTSTGEIGCDPRSITREEALQELERAKRFSEGATTWSDEYDALKETLVALFSNVKE